MFVEQIKGMYKQNLENFDMDEPSKLVIFLCYSLHYEQSFIELFL